MPSLPWIAANAVNPCFVAVLLVEPFQRPKTGDPAWRFWGRTAVGIGLAVLVAEWGKARPVWPHHPSFPSGHETFALAAATFLVRRAPRRLVPALLLLLLLGWALVAAHFHQPVDVLGSLLVGPPIALLCDRLLARGQTPR